MICIYCLRRADLYPRRCGACHDYIKALTWSHVQADLVYAARLIDLAAERARCRGDLYRAA